MVTLCISLFQSNVIKVFELETRDDKGRELEETKTFRFPVICLLYVPQKKEVMVTSDSRILNTACKYLDDMKRRILTKRIF